MSSQSGQGTSGTGRGGIGVILGVAITFVSILGAVYYFNEAAQSGDKVAKYITHASELRVLSQRIAKNAVEAAAGNEEAFAELDKAKHDFQVRWDKIRNGNADEDIVAAVDYMPDLAPQMAELQKEWERVEKNADVILNGSETVTNLHAVARDLGDRIPILQEEYDSVVDKLLSASAGADQVRLAERQSLLAERIVRSVNKVLDGGKEAVTAAESFGRDAQTFGRVLKGMVNGDASQNISKVKIPEAVETLSEIQDLYSQVNDSVAEILQKSPELFQVRQAADDIFKDSQTLLDKATSVATRFDEAGSGNSSLIAYAFSGLAFLSILWLVLQNAMASRAQAREEADRAGKEKSQNERNQQAIGRLLDEMGGLADGDLTVEMTVTEDFTGAIADSINFTIDQLRSLVSTINETAVAVSSAAQETQATAMHLAEASEHQAQEIAGASAAVNEMAVSIDQVSANASESAAVAERSVTIANKGAEVVQNTIHAMDEIRERIQDTSKRIKRLGESSQEIGDIVSLINDIADQTNILALNAAIQASMAGDAGRGFAVVADEVQRLAERASAATKQIEALVRTIQTDTNEAVISMEQTTSDVVRGARLAQDAGVALEEIENVSTSLADLISNISNAARQQAASAGHISNTMNVIQEITSQTTAGTTATATSIGNLAEMAAQMRNSVAGFKLPQNA